MNDLTPYQAAVIQKMKRGWHLVSNPKTKGVWMHSPSYTRAALFVSPRTLKALINKGYVVEKYYFVHYKLR